MSKKLKEQLECRKSWLENKQMRYDAQDFMEDWKKYQKSIEGSYYLGLISDSVYDSCKKVLMEYIHLFNRAA